MTRLKYLRQKFREHHPEKRRHTRAYVKKVMKKSEKQMKWEKRHPFNPVCNFLDCAWGMGCAGRGSCRHGDPMNKDCPGFVPEPTDEEIEAAMREEGKMQVEESVEYRWQEWLEANKPGWSLRDKFSWKDVKVSAEEYNREYEAFMKRLKEEENDRTVESGEG